MTDEKQRDWEKDETSDGRVQYRFVDDNSEACSLEVSSCVDRYSVWLGVSYLGERVHHVTGQQLSHRMLLTRQNVTELIVRLERFRDTGGL